MEWPFITSEGDIAALLQLVSEDQASGSPPCYYQYSDVSFQVDFTVDLAHSQAARQRIDWNSKRAGKVVLLVSGSLLLTEIDDEDIETGVRLRFSRMSVGDPSGHQNQRYESHVTELDSKALRQETHGTTLDGKDAACALKTETGLTNCSACISAAFAVFTSTLIQSDYDLAHRIFDNVRHRGESGLDKAACLVRG